MNRTKGKAFGVIGVLLVSGTSVAFLLSAPAKGDPSAPDDSAQIQEEKIRLLEAYWAAKQERELLESDLPLKTRQTCQSQEPWDPNVELSKDLHLSAQVAEESFSFYGTGEFLLVVEVTERASRSYVGYVVDDLSENHQDMVILEDLSKLETGEHTVLAGCSDLHKSFPPSGVVMSSTPRTSQSADSWQYWVRRVAITGVNSGSSFWDMQAAIWYITDREGDYNSLLQSVGYSRNGPSKNVNDGTTPPGGPQTGGPGLCGVGAVAMLPIILLSLGLMKKCPTSIPNSSQRRPE